MQFQFHIKYHTAYGESLWLSLLGADTAEQSFEKKISMEYLNHDYWKVEVELDANQFTGKNLNYRYLLKTIDGEIIPEDNNGRTIHCSLQNIDCITTYDVWNFAGQFENAFYTAPFKNTLLPKTSNTKSSSKSYSHTFKVKAPLLKNNEVVCILGNCDALNNWNTASPVLLNKQDDCWIFNTNLRHAIFPVAYKYGVYNKKEKSFKEFEQGDNRICIGAAADKALVICNDGFIRLPHNTWKGAGIAIPVFSLKSRHSFGIGEFNDIPLLVDWANKTGFKLIQLLPVNDTTATKTWHDSYPYSAISAFALHPVYLNLSKVAGKKNEQILKNLAKKQKQLNTLSVIDYEEVCCIKIKFLQKIFTTAGEECLQSEGFKFFFEINQHWLKPYAVFCYLRDKYKTPDFNHWNNDRQYDERKIDSYFHKIDATQVYFYCFLQYHLHLQLKEAVTYAHKKGVVLKGDIPIGIFRNSVDAWVKPELYNMDMQAGAPPDDFAVAGQNWGFPTYNWTKMQADGFAWWKQRFEQMGNYFDAFRIDHILGFFRIWSIPNHAVQGIMGRFDPSMPIHFHEFSDNNIAFDYDRFCKPFINEIVLRDIFGDKAEAVKSEFLNNKDGFNYELKPAFDTQRKIEAWFDTLDNNETNSRMRLGLYYLVANVILFEEENTAGQEFYFRIAIDQTLSYQSLPDYTKQQLWNLYIDYFFKRQDDFWRKAAMKKLPALKEATNMLVCGEDLGMVPACVPDVMRGLGILSLEVQRMPKQSDREFFNPADAPYLSVVTPSTHDMSTIRGWWEEDRNVTQRFFNQQLQQQGEAPYFCEPWINKAIVLQHLHSPSMWSIFQLQDILGISAKLRRNDPAEERINVPANPNHYWQYRMHLPLEDLLKENDFNEDLKRYLQESGR